MQNIFFISENKLLEYPNIDKHYTWIKIHTHELSFEDFSEEYQKYKPLAIYTYGELSSVTNATLSKVYSIRKRWVHLDNLNDLDVTSVIYTSVLGGHTYENDHPLVSVITTTFKSKDKIMRPFNSLINQNYTNWEWIIWDDSDDNNETYNNLLKLQQRDLRIRVYKAPSHSGVIGHMKRLASGLAEGIFIVELDHDDDLHDNLFQWIVDASKKYPDADFFYTDCIELTEETHEPVSYGNFFGMGYGAHSTQWIPRYNKWLNRQISLPMNPTSIRHIVGVPNHVRVWKTSFYDSIGKHNSQLSVADDYDLLVRTYMKGKICYIREIGYYQYRNKDGNFTFLRNSLIQHNTAHIYNHYKSKLPEAKVIYEPIWKINDDLYKSSAYTYDPNPNIVPVIMINPSLEDIIQELYRCDSNKRLYIIGPLPDGIEDSMKPYIQYWNLDDEPDITDQQKYNYAYKMLIQGINPLVLMNRTSIDTKKVLRFYDEHNRLIDHKNLEYDEQVMAEKYIKNDCVVLELGARYGSVSCVIHTKLENGNNLVVVEPDVRVWGALERNMKLNGCNFHIVKGFVSKTKLDLTAKDRYYAATFIENEESIIDNFSLEEIEEKYGLTFNTLVADCEGYLEKFMDDNPKLYSQLKLIMFEKDYPQKCNYDKIIENLKLHNFKNIVSGFHDVWRKE